MEAFFLKLLDISYEATIVLGFVLVARLILELLKAPKKYCALIWAIPFLRMILPLLQMIIPFKFESAFSLIPVREIARTGQDVVTVLTQPAVGAGNGGADVILNQVPPATVNAASNFSVNWATVFAVLWFAGVILYFVYGLVSFLQLRNKLKCSIHLDENIYLADYIDTPFVMGIFKSRIYIPSETTKEEYRYILAHEKMHLRRKDHLYKLAVFVILGLHWFNPFAWIAYLLLCKDMEMACDEAVMVQFGDDCKSEYAKALLDWSADKKLKGVPLAFSEGSVKGRIRNVLRYKKPLIGISIVAVVALVVLAICLLSDPVSREKGQDATVKLGYYELVSDAELVGADIRIEEDTMSFSYHALSSYWPTGPYEIDGDMLTLTSREGKQYRFRIDGDCLIFVAEGSEPIPLYKEDYMDDVVDGSVFKYVEEVTLPAEIEITAPALTADMDLGADGAILDYADETRVIFHGYFGLFVYDRAEQALTGAVDLEPIGCNFTQGDDACEVYVEADGSKVYLCPLSRNMMYVYDVAAQTLVMEPHDASRLKIQENVPRDGSCLGSADGTVGQLYFKTLDSEEYYIFKDYFPGVSVSEPDTSGGENGKPEERQDDMEAFEAALQSNIWGMGIEELSRTGMTFTIYNNSDREIQFGEDYKLFVQEDDEWVEVPYAIEYGAFKLPAYPVEPQSTRTETVDWEWLYGELPDGVYLFKKTIMYKKDAGDWENVELDNTLNNSSDWEYVDLGVMFSFPVS